MPGTMTIRIFRGEDLPQMDPGYFEGVKKFLHVGTVQKELVDPYCTVNFAGHKGRTQVIWNEQDPEWNKQINLGVRVRQGLILRFLCVQKESILFIVMFREAVASSEYQAVFVSKCVSLLCFQFPSMCERLRFQMKDK